MRLMGAVPQVLARPAANPALYVGLRWLPGLCATTMQWIIIWKFSGLQLQPIWSAWSRRSRWLLGTFVGLFSIGWHRLWALWHLLGLMRQPPTMPYDVACWIANALVAGRMVMTEVSTVTRWGWGLGNSFICPFYSTAEVAWAGIIMGGGAGYAWQPGNHHIQGQGQHGQAVAGGVCIIPAPQPPLPPHICNVELRFQQERPQRIEQSQSPPLLPTADGPTHNFAPTHMQITSRSRCLPWRGEGKGRGACLARLQRHLPEICFFPCQHLIQR